MTYTRQFRYMTPDETTRQERWDRMNEWVIQRGGWVTSPPGSSEMRIECLPGSTLPDELRDAGYELTEEGQGERILSGSIVERFARNRVGDLVPWSEGMPVAETRTHAGICRVERFSFSLTASTT